MDATIAARLLAQVEERLAADDREFAAAYPDPHPRRQPVHTCYVPADRFDSTTTRRWGEQALELLAAHEDIAVAAAGRGAPDEVGSVLERVRAKLRHEPIEDLRVDFEDGLVGCSETDEDHYASATAAALADVIGGDRAPSRVGIRIRALEPRTRSRGLRTLMIVVGGLAEAGRLSGLTVTLPKVTSVAQVDALAEIAEDLEGLVGLAAGAIRIELQIETPQSVLGPDGTVLLPRLLRAGGGRVTGLHYGTYDYSSISGVAAPYQASDHPVADFAKRLMQLAAADTGIEVSDGSSNIVPVGGVAEIERAWSEHARLVRRALEGALYQGWDLHPGHLVTRYLATYSFYRDGFVMAAERLRVHLRANGVESGPVQDEPATARALALFLMRGVECGALDETEVVSATGSGLADLATLASSRAVG